MATLKDISPAVREVGAMELLKRVWNETNEDLVFTWAAALAYSWIFALFPFLIFLLSLLPYLPSSIKASVSNGIYDWVNAIPSQEAASMIIQNVEVILHQPHKALLSVGLLVTLWSASGGVNMTMSALDRCYDLTAGRSFLRQRTIAFLMTGALAILIILILLLLPVGTVVIHWLEHKMQWAGASALTKPMLLLAKIMRFPIALLLMFLVLHILYHYGPAIHQKRVYISPGAVFCVAVWIALGLVFRFYVEHFGNFNQTYGTVGGAIILLLFFYLDGIVLLMGAEINSEIDFIITKAPRGANDFTGH